MNRDPETTFGAEFLAEVPEPVSGGSGGGVTCWKDFETGMSTCVGGRWKTW